MNLKSKWCLIVLLFSSSFIFSQNHSFFRGGLSLGICASQIDGDDSAGYNKVGLKASVFSTAQIQEHIFLNLAVGFTQKGSRHSDEKLNFKIKLNYIEMPLTVLYAFNDKWKAGVGLSYSYLFSKNIEDNNGSIRDGDDYKSSDINYIVQCLYQINSHWELEANFNYSATNIYVTTPKLFNNVLSFSAKYYF